MILCNVACSASSVGAEASTNSSVPSVPRWYTPYSTLQCRASPQRYRLRETTRLYALGLRAASGNGTATVMRHGQVMVALQVSKKS